MFPGKMLTIDKSMSPITETPNVNVSNLELQSFLEKNKQQKQQLETYIIKVTTRNYIHLVQLYVSSVKFG